MAGPIGSIVSTMPSTLTGMSQAVAHREVSARELVMASLERIGDTAELNAFLTVCAERALDEADQIDNHDAHAGGVLRGVPSICCTSSDTALIATEPWRGAVS